MSKTILQSFAVCLLLMFCQCEKEKDFKYDIHLLTATEWGIPEIQEGGPSGGNFDQVAPTRFYEDGRVTFAGRSDFWQVRDSRSLLIQERQQIWQILELTENKLHVEVFTYPNSEFVVRAIFYPLEE